LDELRAAAAAQAAMFQMGQDHPSTAEPAQSDKKPAE
jgi:hypothetical protein